MNELPIRLDRIEDAIQDIKLGKIIIVADDEDRENEGDLVIPGSKCNSKSINFMAKHGRGLICLALSKDAFFLANSFCFG